MVFATQQTTKTLIKLRILPEHLELQFFIICTQLQILAAIEELVL